MTAATAVPSRGELTDRIATLYAVADNARREAAEALERATAAEDRAIVAEAAVEDATNQLADVLVVLARWGVNIDRGHIGALVEYALREAEARPCEPKVCVA